ncbi:MAG: VWA domain-containing protein [Methanomicrobiales archaeon]|jgi:hypothetical protein
MRWDCIFIELSLLFVLALLLANPAAARGNTTSGIYPGTVKDVCVGDTIFVGETGLNLTPLTPYANGVVQELRKYANDNPDGAQITSIPVPQTTDFNVGSVTYYGIYYPVASGKVLRAYPIQIQPAIPLYPQKVVITSSKDWVSADGIDSALLTVTVTDGGNNPIPGADLVLSASAPWGLRDSVLKTDGSGKVQTLFLPTIRSGAAVIAASASVQGVTTAPVTTTRIQNIDAGTPYSVNSLYPGTATVGTPSEISVLIRDRYGNPVTGRRAATNVSFFTVSSGTGAFLDGTGNRLKAISVPLNETGWAEVTFMVSTLQGDNFIYITPPAPLSASLIDIAGIGDSEPFSVTQSVNPAGNPPFILADGSSLATIDYYLFDQWGNPSIDQAIQITTSAGEQKTFITNGDGRVTVLYGPKLNAGFYTITATAAENSTVKISQTVQFGSMDPTDMLLTASPQTMASSDVNPNMVGDVIAKVIDARGNPVKGQTVTFRIEKNVSSPYIQTNATAIGSGGVKTSNINDPISVITDEDGQAILDYYPGGFTTDEKNPGWSATAEGTTTVNATWVDSLTGTVTVVRFIDLSYKNYPFLSVYTEVSPKTVQVGGYVNVSVRLVGDGWALWPKPIDVVLCTDRSATMLNNESIVSGKLVEESLNDRMVDAMNASNTFVGQTSGQDRIGLVTFGDPAGGLAILYDTGNPATKKYISPWAFRAGRDYACKVGQACQDPSNRDSTDDIAYITAQYPGHGTTGKDYRVNGVMTGAYVESPLTFDKTQITKAINSIVPAGGTPMRRAIYESVKQIINDPEVINGNRAGSVRAIVLLTDGKWNTGGDPRGIVTSPFPIESYPELGTMGTGSVITWANSSNIKIFTVALVGSDPSDRPNTAELQAYADETGGKAYVANSGSDLKNIYIDIAGKLREAASINTQVALDFTNMEVNKTYTLPGNTVFQYEHNDRSTYIVPPQPATPYTVDNTTDWNNGQRFNFSAGTINVNQVWMMNFTLMALTEGNIKVLSSKSSKITFVGTEGGVDIPDTYVTAVPNGTEKGPEGIIFKIENLRRADDGTNTQVASLTWDHIYDGSDNPITWTIWLAPPYSTSFSPITTFTMDKDKNPVYSLLVRDLKPGTYTIKVTGHVRDEDKDPEATLSLTIPEPSMAPQILIQ